MKFTKMHGCGNDYIYINGFTEQVPQQEKSELVRAISDRHFGIGSDGAIFINPSSEADFEMEMYNADGSRAEMCGNGIRCVAKFVYDKGMTRKKHISIISAGKIKYLDLMLANGQVSRVRVNMGSPVLEPELIPVVMEPSVQSDEIPSRVVDEPLVVDGREYRMTCVSMGNPHAVIFAENVAGLDLKAIGPSFENHERFPRKTNTEFVEVMDPSHIFMRVWERGSGETLACGTGACAAAVACILNGLTEDQINVRLLGGELQIEWDRESNLIYMTGPATTVFEGEMDFA